MVKLLTKHSETFDSIARKLGFAGFCSRGFIWASVGIIAVVAAFTGDKTQGTQGALEVIGAHNGGEVFLALITLGIFCYSSWRFFEGIYGLRIDPQAPKFVQIIKGVITPFASGTAYLAFAADNISVIVHGIKQTNSNFTGTLSSHAAGKAFLTFISFFLFVTAIMWIVELIRRVTLADLDMKALSRRTPVKIFVITCAYLGTFGRSILFALLGTLFLRSCYADGIEGGGFGVALQQLQYDTTARIFLVLFGFLLFLFGCFSICQAFYKRFFPYHPHLIKSHREKGGADHGYFGGAASREVRYEKELDMDDRKKKVESGFANLYKPKHAQSFTDLESGTKEPQHALEQEKEKEAHKTMAPSS